jgi:hypothetical protein
MTLFIVVLPLRLTGRRVNLAGMLGEGLDKHFGRNASQSCQADLERLGNLRREMTQQIYEKDSYDEGVQCLEMLQEYYHLLVECETLGAVAADQCLSLEWESSLTGELQAYHGIAWERANVIWNLVCLEAYQASKQDFSKKQGWSKAAAHFQNAACWIKQLQVLPLPDNIHQDFSPVFLQFWQALLIAQSQRCVYESLACAPRPKHLLLAKLAAAAVPLFGELERILKDDETQAQGGGNILQRFAGLTNNWADFARAWGMCMSCKAEFHQAMTSREKKKWGEEIARLDLSYQFATLCLEYCERVPLIALQQLHTTVDGMVKDIQERLGQAEQENSGEAVLSREDLTEIRGEKVVNIEQPLSKILKPYKGAPIFQNLDTSGAVAVAPREDGGGGMGMAGGGGGGGGMNAMNNMNNSSNSDGPPAANIMVYVKAFHTEMDKLVFQMSSVAEERSESARQALAAVNLPHSLTAYNQEQAGGGIPQELWQRVEGLQRERRIAKLKQDLWELRDVAEAARNTYHEVRKELDFDLESDQLFRQSNQGFQGHDAKQVQKSFRDSLANYDRLLLTSQEGDSVLLRRLEVLDTNPKYKLLQFQKPQLDRLLPGAQGNSGPVIDTSYLSRLLVELSGLFHKREILLNTIKEEVEIYDIEGTLRSRGGAGTDPEYREALKYAQKGFDAIVYEMQNNIEAQTELVNTILAENEQFMMARDRTQNSQSADSCIGMIEDAIEEIEQLTKHLKEGRDFYDVVIPKLVKLEQQVGDVSARLTVERLEYEDNHTRNRQQEEDARMAQQMHSNHDSRFQQPGAAQMNNNGAPRVFIDDEKVATLVAMEFDPAKVVAALEKYNNNVDQALNDLLSC